MIRWYWAISCDNTVDDPLVVDSADLGMDPEQLDIGRIVQGWGETACLRVTKQENDGIPDDVLQNHLGLPVYSARLRKALALAGIGGLQYLPVHVFRPQGERVLGFSIANITERRPALDLVHTDYDMFPKDYFLPERRGQVRGLRRVALRADMLGGCDIVRLDEFPASVYVSQRFKQTFVDAAFTGYSFREVLST